MKKIIQTLNVLLLPAMATFSLCGMYTDAEKRMYILQKQDFVASQKIALDRMNMKNKCIYKQAKHLAHYVFQDNYLSIQQQIKSAVNQILSSKEFADYHQYSVMLKAPLIGRDNIEVKDVPIIRPDNTFAQKINDVLAATIPVALLKHIAVLTYFEAYLNYKMDLADSQFIVDKLSELEEEMRSFLISLENQNV